MWKPGNWSLRNVPAAPGGQGTGCGAALNGDRLVYGYAGDISARGESQWQQWMDLSLSTEIPLDLFRQQAWLRLIPRRVRGISCFCLTLGGASSSQITESERMSFLFSCFQGGGRLAAFPDHQMQTGKLSFPFLSFLLVGGIRNLVPALPQRPVRPLPLT